MTKSIRFPLARLARRRLATRGAHRVLRQSRRRHRPARRRPRPSIAAQKVRRRRVDHFDASPGCRRRTCSILCASPPPISIVSPISLRALDEESASRSHAAIPDGTRPSRARRTLRLLDGIAAGMPRTLRAASRCRLFMLRRNDHVNGDVVVARDARRDAWHSATAQPQRRSRIAFPAEALRPRPPPARAPEPSPPRPPAES